MSNEYYNPNDYYNDKADKVSAERTSRSRNVALKIGGLTLALVIACNVAYDTFFNPDKDKTELPIKPKYIDSEIFTVSDGSTVTNGVENAVNKMIKEDNLDKSQFIQGTITEASNKAESLNCAIGQKHVTNIGDEFLVTISKQDDGEYVVSAEPVSDSLSEDQ
jgi:hypothetical protein